MITLMITEQGQILHSTGQENPVVLSGLLWAVSERNEYGYNNEGRDQTKIRNKFRYYSIWYS